MDTILNIKFRDDEIELAAMQEKFNMLGREAVTMSHYELAALTDYDSVHWARFLSDPRVHDALETDTNIIRNVQLRKLIADLNKNKANTATAQLVKELSMDTVKKKEGPIFIYSYIPLNENEEAAPYVKRIQNDPFKNSTE